VGTIGNHRPTLFYKIVNVYTPEYLADMLESCKSSHHNYNLRTTRTYTLLQIKTSSYMNSFVPATIKLWNSLPEDTVNSSYIRSFKNKLKNPRIHANIKLYNYGKRKTNIIRCQLHNQASNLNAHLHDHFLISNPSCDLCGNPYEDSYGGCPIVITLSVRPSVCPSVSKTLTLVITFDW
jgi:hypothetical protein